MISVALAASLAALLARAQPGETVVLPPGNYSHETIANISFAPAVKLDARQAKISDISFRNVTGLHIQGGTWSNLSVDTPKGTRWGTALSCTSCHDIAVDGATFTGPGREAGNAYTGSGIGFMSSDHVTVTNTKFVGLHMGLGFGLTSDFVARGNDFGFMTSDGIDVGQGWRGVIEDNVFHDTGIVEQEHPDGIQLWSKPDTAPTSDIVIRRNKVTGSTQGISAFDASKMLPAGYKLADGRVLETSEKVPYGGFVRMLIEDNEVNVDAPNGISLVNGHDSVVRNNRVSTMPGARFVSKFAIVPSEGGTVHCGNRAGPGAGKAPWSDGGCPAHMELPARPSSGR